MSSHGSVQIQAWNACFAGISEVKVQLFAESDSPGGKRGSVPDYTEVNLIYALILDVGSLVVRAQAVGEVEARVTGHAVAGAEGAEGAAAMAAAVAAAKEADEEAEAVVAGAAVAGAVTLLPPPSRPVTLPPLPPPHAP